MTPLGSRKEPSKNKGALSGYLSSSHFLFYFLSCFRQILPMNGLLTANNAASFAFLRQWIAFAAELGKARVSGAVAVMATALAGCLMPAVWMKASAHAADLCATLPLLAAALMLLFRVFRGQNSLLPTRGRDHGRHGRHGIRQKADMDKAFHAINACAALTLAALCLGRFLDSFPTNLPF